MKTVFNSHSEVCHVWASRSQDNGRANNITFDKDVIYSYGWWPMARFVNDNTILFVNWSYSSSTGKHLSHLRRAIPSYINVLYVHNPGKYSDVPHNDNINDYQSKIVECFNKFQTARTYKDLYLQDQERTIEQLNKYCSLFGLPLPDYSKYVLNTPENIEAIKRQEQRNNELKAIAEQRRQQLIDNSKDELIKLQSAWINGTSNKTYLSIPGLKYSIPFEKIFLRAKDDTIQTSLGANVPLREAKILFDRIQTGKDIKGHKIGYYTVIGLNGTLKIGCHNIERSEIDRLAKSLNWI